MAIGFTIAAELSSYSNAKYIACVSLGYTCSRIWGDQAKPAKEIGNVWFALQPFLFGLIGAAIIFSQIRPLDAGKSIGIVITGQFCRFLAVLLLVTLVSLRA